MATHSSSLLLAWLLGSISDTAPISRETLAELEMNLWGPFTPRAAEIKSGAAEDDGFNFYTF
jgi:hypothetical protein